MYDVCMMFVQGMYYRVCNIHVLNFILKEIV